MLEKSLKIEADVIIYDLEDSVAPHQKAFARENLSNFLKVIFFDDISMRIGV